MLDRVPNDDDNNNHGDHYRDDDYDKTKNFFLQRRHTGLGLVG